MNGYRLTSAEIRFLRKSLGWSGVDFARRFDVAPETVSRWETGAQDMGPMAETVLRLWVTIGNAAAARAKEILEHVPPKATRGRKRPIRATMKRGWKLAAA